MARPRYEGRIYRYRVTLCLREHEDADLIAILEAAGKGELARVIVTQMRLGVVEAAVCEEVDESKAIDTLFGMTM